MRATRMRRMRKILLVAVTLGALGAVISAAVWRSLTYEPPFYRELASKDRLIRRVEADRFVSQTFQLRNDIANENRWEASFTDEEVNAWLAEHLVSHFAEYLPDGVRDPMLVFDLDRVTLAFRLDRGPFTSLVWVVARVKVAGDNTIELRLEKIRAGAFPVSPEEVVGPIIARAKAHGVDVEWFKDRGEPVAHFHYSPSPGRLDVVLERVILLDGRLFISGRSDRQAGRVSGLSLPTRRVLQMNFPILKRQNRSESRRNSASPMT